MYIANYRNFWCKEFELIATGETLEELQAELEKKCMTFEISELEEYTTTKKLEIVKTRYKFSKSE